MPAHPRGLDIVQFKACLFLLSVAEHLIVSSLHMGTLFFVSNIVIHARTQKVLSEGLQL